jgi:hypothetical protein
LICSAVNSADKNLAGASFVIIICQFSKINSSKRFGIGFGQWAADSWPSLPLPQRQLAVPGQARGEMEAIGGIVVGTRAPRAPLRRRRAALLLSDNLSLY